VPGTTDIDLHWVQSLDEAMALKRWLGERRPWLAVDTETSGLDWWRDTLRTVQLGDRHDGWCVEWSMWRGLVQECLSGYRGPIAMHNSKFDTHFLEVNSTAGTLNRWLVHDTRAMAHIVSPAELSGLKPRAGKVLGAWARHGEEELKQAMVKGGWDWGTIPVELLWKYAAFDTVITAQLAEELYPVVHGSYLGVYELELASTQALVDMERRGLLTDRRYLLDRREEWEVSRAAVEHQLREEYSVANPNSDRQVMRALEREAGWRPVLFTEKGNPVLDRDVLKAIDHPVAQLTQEHRDLHKLSNTYAKNLLELADQWGRVHPSINPLGARTGRMSVTRPALQTLPRDDHRIRSGFVSAPGSCLVLADYDQIQMRLFAHFSGDQNMLEAIRYGDAMTAAGHDGYDLHSVVARMTFGIPMDQPVPRPQRQKSKGVGFGKIFGAGLETFAATSGLTLAEAAETIAAFERAFPESRKDRFPARVAEALVRRQREWGDPFVLTPYGRKQPCWPSEAYKAVNYLIQGAEADVVKSKIVALSRTWLGDCMVLPMHDEIVFEVPDEAVHDAVATIQEVMPETERFAVPLTTGAEVYRRWGQKYDPGYKAA
jgi:DNA polymerase-1